MLIPVFESTCGGTQSFKSCRQVSGLLSEFCTVQDLMGLGKLSALWKSGVSCTQTYVNAFGTKQGVRNIVDGRFSEVS